MTTYLYRYIILSYIYLIASIALYSQSSTFTGKIIDNNTKENIAFVNIIYNSKNQGTTTDLNGRFSIDKKENIDFLKVSCIGYDSKLISKETFTNKNYIEIKLEPTSIKLSEVTVLPGINPAHRIIKEVINNAKQNNPDKMRSFSYKAYNKLYFTIEMDDMHNNEVTAPDNLKDSTKKSIDRLRNLLNKQHIFLTESVTERFFMYPDNNKEEIIAQKISGFKNPNFALLTSQLQSVSFYNETIDLLSKQYISPISTTGLKKYYYHIEDTMFTEGQDTIFIISYRPLKKNFLEGIEGIIHINTNKYAIQNISSSPTDTNSSFNINIQHKFEFIDSTQWFPVQLHTNLKYNLIQISNDSLILSVGNTSNNKKNILPLVGIGRTYISDINLNPDIRKRDFGKFEIEIKDNANKKDSSFWNIYKSEDYDPRDNRTYQVIDSIGDELKIDKYLYILEILANGYIPVKFINIDLASIMWYNKFEGYRVGLGLQTNDKLLKWLRLGGYFGYGFIDKNWKYGGNIDFILDRHELHQLRIGYKKDLLYSDDYSFQQNTSFFSDQTIRYLFLDELDKIEQYYINFKFHSLKYLNTNINFNYSKIDILNNSRYNYIYPIKENYYSAEINLGFRYAYKEKFMQMPSGRAMNLGTTYPILYFNIIKGINFLNSKENYTKIEASIQKTIRWKHIGNTSIIINGGYSFGIVPYGKLYYESGNYSMLNIKNCFNTMKQNEFISDRFVNLFFRHDLDYIFYKRKYSSPRPVIVTSISWGDNKLIADSENKLFAKKMDKLYLESGIEINELLNYSYLKLGFGVFYRYGAHSLEKNKDNIVFTFNISNIF